MTKEQLGVCDAFSKHFSIAKAKVRAQVAEFLKDSGESPVIEIASPEGALTVGISKNTMLLGQMLFFKYLKKSELYSDLLNLLDNYNVNFVAFYSKGALLAAYRTNSYEGFGGVFVKDANASEGYVIEPMAHYLQNNYPIYPLE